MLSVDKITIVNSFIRVVQLIKSVRNELSKETDGLKQLNKNSSEIDDTDTDSQTTTLSAKKIKEYIHEKLTELVSSEDKREETVTALVEEIKKKVADTEGLLSTTNQQNLTDEQKQQVLANLGIDKTFLLTLLVDDESTLDSTNVLSAKKVTDLINEANVGVDLDDVVTDAELEKLLEVNSFVPKPTKGNQMLVTKEVEGELVLEWVDKPTETVEPDVVP